MAFISCKKDGDPVIIAEAVVECYAVPSASSVDIYCTVKNSSFSCESIGICFSDNVNAKYDIANACEAKRTTSESNEYKCSIYGLQDNTKYYYRIRLKDSMHSYYDYNVVYEFVTEANVRDYDGNSYGFVKIGNQYWMTENMHSAKYDTQSEAYREGLYTIPTSEKDAVVAPYYKDGTGSGYGYYYNWAAAMGYTESQAKSQTGGYSGNRQGICPNGWHIPTDNEWLTLQDYIEQTDSKGNDTAGKHLKTTSGWLNNGNGMDSYGFSAVPAGYVSGSDVSGGGAGGSFWSSDSKNSDYTYYCHLHSNNSLLSRTDINKYFALSVRCLKSSEETISVTPTSKEIASTGGTFDITIASNTSWTVSSDQTWATLSTASGGGNGTVTVTIAPNTDATAVDATIIFTTPTNKQATVIIKRAEVEKCDASDYPQVIIENQIWMAENYRCSKYDTESEAYKEGRYTIPTSESAVYSPYYTDASDRSKWNGDSKTIYGVNLSDTQVEKLGYLYNWAAAMGYTESQAKSQTDSHIDILQGICPNGWHMPTDEEWQTLQDNIEKIQGKGSNTAGKHLKAISGWYNNDNGLDSYSFTALPAGYALGSSVSSVGKYAYFWTTTPYGINSIYAYYRYIISQYLFSDYNDKKYGQSVRCLKNSETITVTPISKEIASTGGTFNITITSNATWTVSSNQTWTTLSTTNGSGNGIVTVTVAPNTDTIADDATITFITSSNKQATILISRAPLSKDICDNTYSAVPIGIQIWMAENYRCSKYDTKSEAYKEGRTTISTSGSAVNSPYYTDASDKSKWSSSESAGNLSYAQIAKLGYLYNWAAAMGYSELQAMNQIGSYGRRRQGICPNGWHLPSRAEWQTLQEYIEITDSKGFDTAGRHLKTTAGWYSKGNGIDSYGFASLPAGHADGSRVSFVGEYSEFWSSDAKSSESSYKCQLSYDDSNFYWFGYDKNDAMSVRCLMD
ncbi:MAG: hypothetical protein MJ009_03920 [Paludibacteraceae bacterium]|nr:hypothetical protein [Paludibacteraceae bacterium]